MSRFFHFSLSQRFHHLCADQRGATAMMFALALVPLLGMAGAGVEYSRMLATQSRLQNTVYSAALSLVGEASNLTASALLARAKQLVLSGLQGTEAANSVAVNANYNSSTSTVSVTASASLDATLMRVFGYSNLPVAASSKASKSIGTLELALVLDNTGSMQTNGKISALKKASHDLLTSVQSAATSVNAIKVSIVPFDTHVNLGTAVGTQPWMDWSYYSSTDLYGTGADNFDATVIGCTSGNTNATGGANSSESNTQQTGNNTGGNTVLADNGSGKCKPKIVSTAPASWTGCVIDRDMPYDVQNTAPTTDPATWYPGMDCNLATLLPLTTNWSALHAKVDQMQAAGATNLTIGLVWGWNMLTSGAPLSTAGPIANGTKKVLVFLTDGQNTKNAWTSNSTEIDARTTTVCSNIKAGGVTLFTIRVINGNAALLQNCATDPAKYYDVTNSGGIAAAFTAIMQQLAGQARLVQ